jgi:hypothetical protein
VNALIARAACGDRQPSELRRAAPLAGRLPEAQAVLGGCVYRVPFDALAQLQHRIPALARRGCRLGVNPI